MHNNTTKLDFEDLKAAINTDCNALKAIGQGSGTNTSFSAMLAGFRFTDVSFYYLGLAFGFGALWSIMQRTPTTLD